MFRLIAAYTGIGFNRESTNMDSTSTHHTFELTILQIVKIYRRQNIIFKIHQLPFQLIHSMENYILTIHDRRTEEYYSHANQNNNNNNNNARYPVKSNRNSTSTELSNAKHRATTTHQITRNNGATSHCVLQEVIQQK
jgi:hypothetical protein